MELTVKNTYDFEVCLLDADGIRHTYYSSDFTVVKNKKGEYVFGGNSSFGGEVVIKSTDEAGGKSFQISVKENTDMMIESVKFPIIKIPCRLKGDGGDTVIFWPSMEGTLIERADNSYYSDAVVRNGPGYTGLTPGGAAMQFMAVYNDKCGLYIGTHDCNCNFKDFEYYFEENDILRLECTHFGCCEKGRFLPYKIVIRNFKGDWQDAADIYRKWLQSSGMDLPQKLIDRKDLPAWIFDSPIPVIYPIRGESDRDCNGKMRENCYYPYSNILSVTDRFAEILDSRIMPLIMHWEGSAPWANPYVWPPYGDKDDFEYTVKELHKKGNLVGLYGSGIGFTLKSKKDEKYDNSKVYFDEKWADSVCLDSQGKQIEVSALSFVRDGYETCPYCEQTRKAMVNEALKIANAGVDYFQAYDQNIGGIPHFCWSKKHGHPHIPGKWLTDSMGRLMSEMNTAISNAGKNMLFGCELAASEPMLKYLNFNDLRWFTGLRQGRPVRAYSYIYHEYICNFMGNQNGLEKMIDFAATPDNLLYRTAYSFLAGDMLAVVLGNNGRLSWGWNAPFAEPVPEEELVLSFIKNANNWRRSFAKKYLYFGELLKTQDADCHDSVAFVTLDGYNITDKVILNQRFKASDGTVAEFFVNRTFEKQKLKFKGIGEDTVLYVSPEDHIPVPENIILKPADICCLISNGKICKRG